MKIPALSLFAAGTAALVLALVGCETEKLSDTQLSINPAKATLSPGQSVTLTAQGGWDYTWKVAQGTGTLSSYNGKKVTYTASAASYTPSSSSSTNSYYYYKSAFAKAEEESFATAIIEVRSGDLSATATITIKGQ